MMLSCKSKGVLDHDREMELDVDLEGFDTYLDPLEGENESHLRSIMKS